MIYINTDGNGRGFMNASGSHEFQHLVNEVAKDVKDPETDVSVAERSRAQARVAAFDKTDNVNERTLTAAESGGDLPIGALGSGSDYSAYLQHLGLPALNLGFGGEDEGDGVYHSIYDSFYHFTTFDDPGLKYGAALSKVVGRLVLRIADSDTPPQRFADFADTVGVYLTEVTKLADERRTEDEKRAKLFADGVFKLASDPLHPVGQAIEKAATPRIELAALANAVDRLGKAAKAYDAAYADKGTGLTQPARDKLNAPAARTSISCCSIPRGLPEREWYRHMIYAPGRFTGYGAKTLPGVREAIEERRFDDCRGLRSTHRGSTGRLLGSSGCGARGDRGQVRPGGQPPDFAGGAGAATIRQWCRTRAGTAGARRTCSEHAAVGQRDALTVDHALATCVPGNRRPPVCRRSSHRSC